MISPFFSLCISLGFSEIVVYFLCINLFSCLPPFLQPKSSEQREKVRKASTEGIAIQGQQGARLLPEQLLKEAFILSDLFDLGELAALELLLAGNAHTLCSTRRLF